jgi:hypothetical protein
MSLLEQHGQAQLQGIEGCKLTGCLDDLASAFADVGEWLKPGQSPVVYHANYNIRWGTGCAW